MEILEKSSPEVKELLELLDEIAVMVKYVVEKHVPHLCGERYLIGKEVCRQLRIKMRTLQEYRDKGVIAFYKIEGKIIYKQSDIERMLTENYCEASK